VSHIASYGSHLCKRSRKDGTKKERKRKTETTINCAKEEQPTCVTVTIQYKPPQSSINL